MSSSLASETGRTLGGRYRLVAPVGVGTSSRVYLAVDTQLRRRVAVKLLHEALAEDEAFLRRFRAEARAAGALSHPNILAVFDWGEDRSEGAVVPYLVTEYLGGGSLRNILDRAAPLSPSQTLLVGLDAARALAHAHQRGLVHRDVKPANLLFDDDGRLRLADFGLARALAEASWTEPSGIAAGTARYSSPEQAFGRRLDGRSDVYSLALVLVECATGSVPFAGETTASTLAMRTQGDLRLGPEMGGLRSVLERAGRLDPDERPEAAEFEIGLMASAEDLDRPEPLPIVPTLGVGEQTSEMRMIDGLGAVSLIDLKSGSRLPEGPAVAGPSAGSSEPRVVEMSSPVVIEPASGIAAADTADARMTDTADTVDTVDTVENADAATDAGASPDKVAAEAEQPVDAETAAPASDRASARSPITVAEEHELLSQSRPASFGPVDPVTGIAAAAPVSGATAATSSRSSKGRRVIAVLLVFALIAAAVAGWWFFIRVPTHDLPDFVGDDVVAATSQAGALGWSVDDAALDRRDGTVAGEVLDQDPGVGVSLAEGEVVRLTVSLGPTLALVPAVATMSEPDARAALTGAGFPIGTVTRAFDEEVPVDAVVGTAPAADAPTADALGQLPKGTAIDLVLSDGPAPRVVPDGLQGARADDAQAALEALQLAVARSSSPSEDVPEGFVISVSETSGTELARGSQVVLEVSSGPPPIEVPDVRFNSGAVATEMLEDGGFVVSGIEGSPSGMVLATDPPAGELHRRGTSVRVFTRN